MADQATVGEIIVTAQKRATNLQRTPVAITAIAGKDLPNEQIKTLNDVSSVVPSLRIGSGQGVAQVTIRGIGGTNINPGDESPVAVNVNEVYISRQTGVLTSLYDLDSLEILRGPQGTLYGRNATAGAINVRTARPSLDQWGGHIDLSAGNYSTANLQTAVGGPLIEDKLAIQLAGFYDHHDGYFKNIATGNRTDGRDAKGFRGTILAKPTTGVTATVIADYYLEDEDTAGIHYFGSDNQINLPSVYPGPPSILLTPAGYLPSNIRDIASGFDPRLRLETASVTGILEYVTGPITLRSITGYRHQDFATAFSIDTGAAPGDVSNGLVVKGEPDHQLSQELQAHYDTTRLHFTLGGYYFNETDTGVGHVQLSTNLLFASPLTNPFGLTAPTAPFYDGTAELSGIIKTQAEAAFGQADYTIFDDLTLTLGLRYSNERKTYLSYNYLNIPVTTTHPEPFNPDDPLVGGLTPYALAPPQYAAPASFSSTTPRLGLQYQFDSRTMGYFSYSKGFKAGGFDVSQPASAPAYGPEKLDAYEIGLKSDLLGRKLRVDLSVFHYNYTDLQVQEVVGFGVFTQNAGSAESNGGELELTYKPLRDWTFVASGAYLNAYYASFVGASTAETLRQYISPTNPNVDFSGKQLNNAPHVTAFGSAEKTFDLASGELSAKAEVEYSSRFYFTPDNVAPLDQGSYAKVNLFLGYQSPQRWSVSAYARNLTDRVTKTSGQVLTVAVGSPIGGSVSDPRTVGIKFGYRF